MPTYRRSIRCLSTIRCLAAGIQPAVLAQNVILGSQAGLEIFAIETTGIISTGIVVILARVIPAAFPVHKKAATGFTVSFLFIRVMDLVGTDAGAAAVGMEFTAFNRVISFAPVVAAIFSFPRAGLAMVSGRTVSTFR